MEYIAHLSKDGLREQTVNEHSKNVVLKSQKYAEDTNTQAISSLAGWLHDVGKLTKKFTGYIYGDTDYKRGDIDHSYAGAKYILSIAPDSETAKLIAKAIVSHHGLHDWCPETEKGSYDYYDYLEKRTSKTDCYSEIKENINTIISDEEILFLLNKADKEYSNIKNICDSLSKQITAEDLNLKNRPRFKNENNRCPMNQDTFLYFYMGMFERLILSILMDADRTDTASFAYNHDIELFFNTEKVFKNLQYNINNLLKSFSVKTDPINKQRQSISDRCFKFAQDNKVDICRLIVPTGGGKTLSSLRFASEYALRNNKKKIIYIAPFMSILEQNSDIICNLAGKENTLEHYSDFLANIEQKKDLEEYELRSILWDSPVITTTLVQFLNSLFSSNSASIRRMHRLANSVIVIDELQSIPSRCMALFNLAINFLAKVCNCTIVLCSATQRIEEIDENNNAGYENCFKILVDNNNSMTGSYNEDFLVFKRTEVIPKVKTSGWSIKEVALFCKEQFELNGNLLLIANTKQEVKDLFKEIKSLNISNTEIIHLSTNMCPAHRKATIDRMKSNIDDKRIICVTTQLIEAGVDISFRCVVRISAGLDNIAQAAGRCNRNGETGIISPTYVLNLESENLGSALLDIQMAQIAADDIMINNKYADLLSVEAINDFMKSKIKRTRKEIEYPTSKNETTLFRLLSDVPIIKKRKRNKYIGQQAFKTAGDSFKVIDNGDVTSIVVPYNETATALIKELSSEGSYNRFNALRQIQRYTVDVYNYNFNKLLESGKVQEISDGIYELKKEHYSKDFGIIFDNDSDL